MDSPIARAIARSRAVYPRCTACCQELESAEMSMSTSSWREIGKESFLKICRNYLVGNELLALQEHFTPMIKRRPSLSSTLFSPNRRASYVVDRALKQAITRGAVGVVVPALKTFSVDDHLCGCSNFGVDCIISFLQKNIPPLKVSLHFLSPFYKLMTRLLIASNMKC